MKDMTGMTRMDTGDRDDRDDRGDTGDSNYITFRDILLNIALCTRGVYLISGCFGV